MCKFIVGLVSSAAVGMALADGDVSPETWVDPSIGTAATGHAFPGPCRPFGLVQPSPDTGNGSWKYCSGYAWTDTSIRRFSQTHVSGTGQAGLGDVGILPFVGDIPDPQTASAPFAKSDERIELGYYGVTLESGVRVEIAAGRRLARYRISFPAGSRGGVILDFPWGLYRQKEYLPHLTTTCEVSRVSPWLGLVTNVLVEKCRFENPRGFVWHILNGGEMTFRDNVISLNADAPYAYLPYAGSLYVERAKVLYCSGNVFISKTLREAGVYATE